MTDFAFTGATCRGGCTITGTFFYRIMCLTRFIQGLIYKTITFNRAYIYIYICKRSYIKFEQKSAKKSIDSDPVGFFLHHHDGGNNDG